MAGLTTDMVNARTSRKGSPKAGWSSAPVAACAAVALLAGVLWAQPAAAGPDQTQQASQDHYQVYIGGRGETSYTVNREWGSVRLTEPGSEARATDLSGLSGGSGVTYFTPSLSGLRVGVGMSGSFTRRNGAPDAPDALQYTNLGPRSGPSRESLENWQVGGTLGYSALEVGANIGDHRDPSCGDGESCKTNDFWDVGVALRIGSGAVSAGYTASQPRSIGSGDAERIDIFSLNAGYKVSPGLDIYGGVDWIDLNSTNDGAETPLDTRFMMGTNLRF